MKSHVLFGPPGSKPLTKEDVEKHGFKTETMLMHPEAAEQLFKDAAAMDAAEGWPKTVTHVDGTVGTYNSRSEWSVEARKRFETWLQHRMR